LKRGPKAKDWFPNDKATHEWLNSVKKSRRTYLTLWQYFLDFTGLTGDQILESRKTDKEYTWEKKVLEFKQWVIDVKEKGEKSAVTASSVARSFFSYHRLPLKFRRSESAKLTEEKRKTEDYRFSREDLKKMSDVADLTEKYVIVAGKSFGLRAGDFLALSRGDFEPYINRDVPICIGPYATQKESVKAYPFVDSDAQPIIKLMLEKMSREGRTDPNERVLTYTDNIQLSRVLKRVAERAGIKHGNKKVRFHCLRKFLTDRLSSYMSESKWKQVVGKSVDEKAYVSADELRTHYARVMVDTCWTGIVPETDVERRVKIEILVSKAKDLGLNEDEIRAKLTAMNLDDFDEFLRKEARKRSQPIEEDCQRIVSEEELGGYLAKGWKVQAVLPSGRIVVDNEC